MNEKLIHVIVNTVALLAVSHFFDKFTLSGVGAAIIASLLLTIINSFIRPILIFLTLPVTVLTLGFFLIVINAFTLYMTSALMGRHFIIEGFSTALIASVIISILNMLIRKFIVELLR